MANVNPEKMVTIRIVECQGLVSKCSDTNMVPFFYYQFYTYEEHYSPTL